MRVFLDECVNRKLARELIGHDVRSARQLGWHGLKNGTLLRKVAGQFEIFLTLDRAMEHQQNVSVLPFAIILLRTPTNRMRDLKPRVPLLLEAMDNAPVGMVTTVGSKDR